MPSNKRRPHKIEKIVLLPSTAIAYAGISKGGGEGGQRRESFENPIRGPGAKPPAAEKICNFKVKI